MPWTTNLATSAVAVFQRSRLLSFQNLLFPTLHPEAAPAFSALEMFRECVFTPLAPLLAYAAPPTIQLGGETVNAPGITKKG